MIKQTMLMPLLLGLCLLFLPTLLPAAPETTQQLIPFKGIDLNGQPLNLESSIGSKPVMLVFWASWCPSCKEEMPKVNRLAEKYRARGMEFIAINVGHNDSVERAQAFVRKTGITYPVYFDGAGRLAQQYRLLGVPTIIIADRQGRIQFNHWAVPDITEENFAQLMAEKTEKTE